jgi:hypothetical protein
MPLNRDSRAEKKLKAVLRARFALKQKFERIDWEEDELYPQMEQLKAGKGVLGLADGMAFELVIEDAHPDPAKAPDAD